jgi:hypothetical protein
MLGYWKVDFGFAILSNFAGNQIRFANSAAPT